MRLPVPFCVAMALGMAMTPARAQIEGLKETLQIGTLLGVARPEGFTVEDLRTPEMRTASEFKQTYKAPFPLPFQRQSFPLARYERNLGDGELNIAAPDLLAEKLIERYGAALKGKRLTVHAFTYSLEQVINKPQGMNVIAVGPGSLGTALAVSIIGSAAGTAMLKGKGIDLTLQVKIDAELDGKRIVATESPMTLQGTDGPARITRYALEKFLYRLDEHEREKAAPAATPETPEPPKAD